MLLGNMQVAFEISVDENIVSQQGHGLQVHGLHSCMVEHRGLNTYMCPQEYLNMLGNDQEANRLE